MNSYVAALELRIEKLERRLDYAKSRKDSVGQHEADGTTNTNLTEAERRDSLAAIRAAIHRKAARNREDLDVNSLVSDFGILYELYLVARSCPLFSCFCFPPSGTVSNSIRICRSVDATTRDFEPSLGNITFARLVLAVTTKDSLPEPPQSMLPSRQAANTIVQYFMANIYSLFPCFSETALLTILDDVYRQDDRVIRDSDYWLLFLVLAIGSTSQSRKINDEYYVSGVNFVCRAMSYADRALGPGYVTQIQSLLLLTIYSMLDPAHFDTWHLIGFTSRAVVDLGLHQDPPTSSVSDRSALDMRRKIFYCTYALDRSVISLLPYFVCAITCLLEPVLSVWPMLGASRLRTNLLMLHSLKCRTWGISRPIRNLYPVLNPRTRPCYFSSSAEPSHIGTRFFINQSRLLCRTLPGFFGRCAWI